LLRNYYYYYYYYYCHDYHYYDHNTAMTQLTLADLKEFPSLYDSPRHVGDVLIGEDTARRLIEASSSGNDTALRSLLSQPQWIKTMLEKPHCIYSETRGSNGERKVMAVRTLHLERCLIVAAQNGHAAVVSTLLAFANLQSIDAPGEATTRTIINKIIDGGHAAVFKALASADPTVVNFRLPHGTLPLYEAAKRRKTDVVAVLLEFGADPLHPVQQSNELGSYHSSLMSLAAMSEGSRMTKVLLEHGSPLAHTGALHTAARRGQLDTVRLLMQHGADVNEVLSNWHSWTPMHFAASGGQVDAMKLLEQYGAQSDLKDVNGKTPAQLLQKRNTA
jgi:ankyrin repeat protein